jgi:Holliday junction resolvase RusA-like endonuclease
MEIQFPIEFLVPGTPVSSQGKLPKAKEEWKARVRAASIPVLPAPHFAASHRISVTLFYFPDEPMQGDVDNIVKLVLDAMSRHIYIDDAQVERIVVQKFEPGNVFAFGEPSAKLEEALSQ